MGACGSDLALLLVDSLDRGSEVASEPGLAFSSVTLPPSTSGL